jgi:trk system potassium uptake protein TrkH
VLDLRTKKLSPYLIFIIGFAILIATGTLLLMLPFATVDGYKLTFIDALFTSTSAVCVTGLLSVPTISGVYTLFGKIVIIVLVEVGGLGFITVATFLISLFGGKIGIQDR